MIAAILDKAVDVHSQVRTSNKIGSDFKQSVFTNLFGDLYFNQNLYPIKTIEEISEFVLDGTHGSPIRTEIGVPVLSAKNIKHGKLNFETSRFTTLKEYDDYAKRLKTKRI